MKSKKSEKSNLEKKTTLFFQMGLVIALAGLLVAFESGQSYLEVENISLLGEEVETPVDIAITRPDPPDVKPPALPIELIVIEDTDPDIIEIDLDLNVDAGINESFFPIFEDPEENVKEPEFFVRVEVMPKYMGGDEMKFQRHLQSLVRYPQEAVDMGIQGMVSVNFIVNEKGVLTNPTIVRSPDELLSDAVMDAIGKTKKWKPGKQRSREVPVTFTIPVIFKLQ